MAGLDELDKSVRKFVTLWQSGGDANFYVESAIVNLRVGLPYPPLTASLCRLARWCPTTKQWRPERRAAARKATAAAEKAAENEKREQNKVGEEALAKEKN